MSIPATESMASTAPAPADSSAVAWRPWGAAAFAAAQDADQPVILSINAVWCYWCQVMDGSTYADPAVRRFVNEHFIPIRVDTDHRPDINARYNVGGWPTTSFLTPHGGYIAGATYLPPDQFLAMLDEVARAYAQRKPELYEQGNDILRQRREHAARVAAGQEPDSDLVDRITRRVAGAYDPRNGGFGAAPKFPSAPMLRLLLYQYRTTGEPFFRAMLTKSLDAITGGSLHDAVDGGFFRFAGGADWTLPQHEKMAEDNIALAGILLDAAILLARPDYRECAGRAVDYILATLYDADAAGILGSQGAHSDYFGMPAARRATLPAPPVDPYCYASLTAQGASLLFTAAWKLGRAELAETAAKLLDNLVVAAANGRLAHTFNTTATASAGLAPSAGDDSDSNGDNNGNGDSNRDDGSGDNNGFGNGDRDGDSGDWLGDWAYFLLAALDGYDAVIAGDDRYRAAAESAAGILLTRFQDSARGGFYDIEDTPDRPGYLRVREKPLAENTAVAAGLMRLHHITGEARYRQAAHHALSAYADANRDYGELAADYAVAVDRYLNPAVEVALEGRPGAPDAAAMLAAALRLDAPNLLVKPAISGDRQAPAQAHICLDNVCYPPVSDPAALADAARGGGNLPSDGSPFQNVLDLLG